MNWQIESQDELPQVAQELLKAFGRSRVFAFTGEMGAGKTTFIKVLCEALGVKDQTASPTFSLVNEYHAAGGVPVYHFDCYRLRKPEEALDIGFEEYVNSGHYCFIEWPEMVGDLLPDDAVRVTIRLQGKARVFDAAG